jgi:hypothetical protein
MATTVGPFLIGAKPTLIGTCETEAHRPSTPSAVTVYVRDPAGAETTTVSPNAAITFPAVGLVAFTMPTLNQAGVWYVHIKGTAGLIGAGAANVVVEKSPITAV